MTPALDIEPRHLAEVRRLLAEHAPRPSTVWVFGSRVRGGARRTSDLDLAIDAGRPLTLAEQADLATAFEEAPLPWRVDVVDWTTASDTFRRRIGPERVPLTIPGSGG